MPNWSPTVQIPSHQAYDIVGDIHGELESLKKLLQFLGYHAKTHQHPEDRKLLFIGDFVDRGPHSLEVLHLVQEILGYGQGYAILGNHEMNTLLEEAKPGSGWIFHVPENQKNIDTLYSPYQRINNKQKQWVMDFLLTLPLTLEHEHLRLAHACWHDPSIQTLKKMHGKHFDPISLHQYFSKKTKSQLESFDWYEQYLEQRTQLEPDLYESHKVPPFCEYIGKAQVFKQMNHPIKVITGGVEIVNPEKIPFFAQKWRFAQRAAWWETDYPKEAPLVIFGHYWRSRYPSSSKDSLFSNTAFNALLGEGKNAFCIDYSIGKNFLVRKNLLANHLPQLASLSYPHPMLHFHTGESIALS